MTDTPSCDAAPAEAQPPAATTLQKIANFVLFQIGWFACVLPAGDGNYWIGPLATLAIVGIHLAWVATPPRTTEFVAIAGLAGLGCATDIAQTAAGFLQFEPAPNLLGLPYWMVSLWVLFATILGCSLTWLRGRWLLAALFGAIGAPLSYLAGDALGALKIPDGDSRTWALISLGAAWAIYTPVAIWLASRRRTG